MDIARKTDQPRKRAGVHSSAWAVSLVVHGLLVGLLALLTWAVVRPAEPPRRILLLSDGNASSGVAGGARGEGVGEAGPSDGDSAESASAAEALRPPAPPPPSALDSSLTSLMSIAPAPEAGGGSAFAGVMKSLAAGSSMGGTGPAGDALHGVSPGFGRDVDGMQRRGLDIVLILDATDSMRPTIEDAKVRLRQVIKVVTHIVPKARFGMVAFKDYGDDYGPEAIRVQKITSDRQAVQKFLDEIRAGGGGDDPEPIDEALAAAIHPTGMGWRRGAQRVIVLIGDAPVHPSGRNRALQAARQFRKTGGRISTIDVNARGEARGTVLADLERIAAFGGGGAFSLGDGDEFWRHLIISVFGAEYTDDVNIIIERVVREDE